MTQFFLSTRISKVLSSSETAIREQIDKLFEIVSELSTIDPIFEKWYINNPVGSKPPYDYPIPTEKARNYLFDLRKNDINEIFLLWNGSIESAPYAGFYLAGIGSVLSFKKVLKSEQVIQIFEVLLKYFKFDYIYLNSFFFGMINIYPHRLPTTSICYVPINIAADYLPHLYKKVDVDNQYNKGTILVFAENWADETDELKKIVQENSIALIELGVIPETGLPENFYDE